jgi:hypothetical protein
MSIDKIQNTINQVEGFVLCLMIDKGQKITLQDALRQCLVHNFIDSTCQMCIIVDMSTIVDEMNYIIANQYINSMILYRHSPQILKTKKPYKTIMLEDIADIDVKFINEFILKNGT